MIHFLIIRLGEQYVHLKQFPKLWQAKSILS
jgi:hypothetical protein